MVSEIKSKASESDEDMYVSHHEYADRERHNQPRKSIFDRESVKVVPKVEIESDVGIKMTLTEQSDVVTRHAQFVKVVYFLLISSVIL